MRTSAAALLCVVGTTLAAQVPAEVRGRVTDDATGRAIAGAEIVIAGRGEHAETGADGAFVLRGLEPRHYRLRARSVGFAPMERDADVENGRVTTIDFALHAVSAMLDPVLVRGDAEVRAPGTTSIDRRAIESSGRHDVGELLQTVPSVVLTQTGGPGSPTQISIRGSSADQVLVLLDGVPINSPITGTADLSRIALATVERVTVIPGALSARYGARALAGVVLIETRRADDDASLSASVGSWGDRTEALSLGAGTMLGESHVGGSIAAQRRDVTGDFAYDVPDVRGGGTARRTNADVRSSSVLGASSLELGATFARGRLDWEETVRGVAGSIVQPSSTGRAHENRLAGSVDARTTFSNVAVGATLDAAREQSHFEDPDPPFGGRYDDLVDAHEARGSLSASVFGRYGVADVGAESRHVGVNATSLATGSPRSQQFTAAWLNAKRGFAMPAGLNVDATVAERIDHESLAKSTSLSPRATIAISKSAASLSLSGGGAFSPPSLADRFFHEGVLVRANPSLQPERVRHEIELRAVMRDLRLGLINAGIDAAVYRADINGMILWVPDFRFIWSPSNFDVRRAGWEGSAHIDLPSLGTEVRGTIDRTDVTYTGAVLAGQVAYRPRTTGSLALMSSGRAARIDVTTRYVGARRTVPGSELNLLAPYWLTDATVSVPVRRAEWTADATIGVINLFDRPAAMLVDYPFGGRRWTIGLRLRRGSSRAN